MLVLRYAESQGMNPAASSTIAASGSNQVLLVSAPGQRATLFTSQDSVPATPLGAEKGRYVYKYHTDVYYLQPCSDRSGGSDSAHCDSKDDGGNPIPTLARLSLESNGSLKAEPMVEGVEQLQFEYGISSTDPSRIVPEVYKSAADVSAAEWARVISVHIGLVARGQARDVAVPQAADFTGTAALSNDCGYKIAADGTVTIPSKKCTGMSTATLGDKPQQFTRLRMSQVMQTRNRTRG